MKKILFVLAAGLFVLASCKKDYTCECTMGGANISTRTIKDTKSKATTECEAGSSTIFGTTITCAIK